MTVTDEMKIGFLEDMLLIRAFDEAGADLVNEGRIYGEVHQYIGQEAIAVGVSANLRKEDGITSNHRGHGHLLAKGGSPDLMMAEIGGRENGYCKGKGGSMHITSLDLGIFGTNGMVGQGVPIALGVAFANKYKGNDLVTVGYFGDGAANEGAVLESMNMAALWSLPLIFVCEHNMYGAGTSATKSSPLENISTRAAAFGMEAITIDGNNVIEVYETAKKAVERARNGEGPTFIEAKTYRHFGHFSGEQHLLYKEYRPAEEIEYFMAKDPIITFKDKLMNENIITEDDFNKLKEEAYEIIDKSIEFMEASDYPDPQDAYKDAYDNEHVTMPVKGWS